MGGVSLTQTPVPQDWYPEHFEYPVAYHPTAPCSRGDTAYRTFDRSFSYDATTHSMVYEPLAMRDMDYVHTNLGAEGLCRTSNIGLDMQVCKKKIPIARLAFELILN